MFLDGQSRFCSNTQHLLGKEATKRRHVRRMGYEVVQVWSTKCFRKNKRKTVNVFMAKVADGCLSDSLIVFGDPCSSPLPDPLLWIREAEYSGGTGPVSSQQDLSHHLQVPSQILVTQNAEGKRTFFKVVGCYITVRIEQPSGGLFVLHIFNEVWPLKCLLMFP